LPAIKDGYHLDLIPNMNTYIFVNKGPATKSIGIVIAKPQYHFTLKIFEFVIINRITEMIITIIEISLLIVD